MRYNTLFYEKTPLASILLLRIVAAQLTGERQQRQGDTLPPVRQSLLFLNNRSAPLLMALPHFQLTFSTTIAGNLTTTAVQCFRTWNLLLTSHAKVELQILLHFLFLPIQTITR